MKNKIILLLITLILSVNSVSAGLWHLTTRSSDGIIVHTYIDGGIDLWYPRRYGVLLSRDRSNWTAYKMLNYIRSHFNWKWKIEKRNGKNRIAVVSQHTTCSSYSYTDDTCTEKHYTYDDVSRGSCNSNGRQSRTQRYDYSVIKIKNKCSNIRASTQTRNCTYTYPTQTKNYKYSYDNAWSNCSISSNWNSNKEINCNQKNNYTTNTKTFTKKHTVYGWNHTYKCNDGLGQSDYSCSRDTSKSDASTPTNLNSTTTLRWNFTTSNCTWNLYANNKDSCNVKVDINISIKSWNTIKSSNWGRAWLERVVWINWYNKVRAVTDNTKYSTNKINWHKWDGHPALNFPNTTSHYLTINKRNNSNYYFNIVWIKSRSPISDNNWKINFAIKWKTWFTNYNNIWNISYLFKVPFSLEWKINDSETDGSAVLFKKQEYNLILKNEKRESFDAWNLKLFANQQTVYNKVPANKHKWIQNGLWINQSNYIYVNNHFKSNGDKYVKVYFGELEPINEWDILTNPEIDAPVVPISYNLWGQLIKYNLKTKFKSCNIKTLWLKISGIIQWSWRSETTTAEWANFSNMDKFEYKTQIRKNAYKLIRHRESDTIINGVKYVYGDYNINSIPNYETIIVKNWNLIIEKDNIKWFTWKPLWIIVLQDWYNVKNKPSSTKWNIYVNNNVKIINAVIYSDWAFRSADVNWNSYDFNNLEDKLILNWSLFSRNTIWGSVKITGSYKIPWDIETSDWDLAKEYDLNLVRKVPEVCFDENNPDSGYSFFINYDSSVQSNPPKWFEF